MLSNAGRARVSDMLASGYLYSRTAIWLRGARLFRSGRRCDPTPCPSPGPPASANPINAAACILSSTIATAGRIPPRQSTRSPDTRSSGLHRRTPGWDSSNGAPLPAAPPTRIAGMPRRPKCPPAARWPCASCRPCPSTTLPPYRRTTSELPNAYPPYTPHIPSPPASPASRPTAPATPTPAAVPGTAPATAPVPAPAYSEAGVASWYGHPYHGRPAADGEIYDMEQLVAAHRTLPRSE